MKTIKFKRAMLMLTLLVMTLSAVTGGTIAWFTDTVESNVNTISAGNLDIELYLNDTTKVEEDTPVFTMPKLWEPGAVATAHLTLKNVGNLTLNYTMTVTALEENAVNVLEAYKLSDVLKIAFVAKDAVTNWNDRQAVLNAAKTSGVPFSGFTTSGYLLAGEESSVAEGTLVVYWEPGANDNNWNVNNGKTVTPFQGQAVDALMINLGLNVEATQRAHEEDSFGSDYDAGANASYTYDSTKSAKENGDALKSMIMNAAAGSTISIPNGDYEFTWSAGSPIDITKSITLIGESEDGVKITVKDGFGFRISDNKNPASDMHVVLKNMTLKSEGAKREGIYVKYNVTVDLYNVSVSGFSADIMLDNGNTYADGKFHAGTATTVNAYNVDADKVLMNATPCGSGDYATAPVTYAYFNYDAQSNIGGASKQGITQNAANLFVNGKCINAEGAAVVYASPANVAAEIAKAAAGSTIMLQAGIYEDITLPANTNGLTIKAAETPVQIDNINLNSAKNVLIEGVIFDAAEAEAVYAKSGNLQGYANIGGAAKGAPNGAESITIRNCKFIGTAADVTKYYPILFYDQGRPTSRTASVTIESCEFQCDANQYIKLDYLAAGNVYIKNNVFGGNGFGTEHNTINASSNSSNWYVTGNKFYNWNPDKVAFGSSRSSGDGVYEFEFKDNEFHNTSEAGIINLKTRPNEPSRADQYLTGNHTILLSGNTYYGALTQNDSNAVTYYE